jgi:phosphomannomutase
VTAVVRGEFSGRPGVSLDELDGLTVSGPDWWFNLRPSNTEPQLRLNVEAGDEAEMARLRDEVLRIIRGPGEAGRGKNGPGKTGSSTTGHETGEKA